MKKSETLAHWKSLPITDPLPKMIPIHYKAQGSRYGACGIRIDGTPEFIDAILSNLKSLINGENQLTRLELARNVVDGSGIGKVLPNATTKAECCYIRLHERGREGQISALAFDKHLDKATKTFCDSRSSLKATKEELESVFEIELEKF